MILGGLEWKALGGREELGGGTPRSKVQGWSKFAVYFRRTGAGEQGRLPGISWKEAAE